MEQPLPQSAQAVVIGGGIVGLSVLYHLTKMGWKDVVLLEKHELTSGTTWHSAALVSPMRGTRGQTTMARYSGDLYESLRDETGIETGMRRCGHLNVATSEARLEELQHNLTLMRSFELEAEMVDQTEVTRRWPMMETSDVLGAIWTPSSGRADPSNICQAFAKVAKAEGAKIIEHTRMTGIHRQNSHVAGVETDRGKIETGIVINCAGLWGRDIGAIAGERAPLFACEHFYLLTETMEGITSDLPVFRDGDSHLYVREEVGGLLVGCFEPNPRALPMEKLPHDSAYILLNEDWDHFGPMLEGAMHRIPALETTGVRMLLNGPESFTQDNSPLMGEAPGLRGFWYCCGMNSAGVVLGGGAGWATAEWIVNGAPPVDLASCDVKRFPAALDTAVALSERIPEVLAHHFTIRWPGREMETARGARRSALHDRLAARGAAFGARSGWEKPLYFDPAGGIDPTTLGYGRPVWQDAVEQENTALRDGVVLFDQSSFGKIRIQGSDAEKVLQRLCAADIEKPGYAHYTAMLNDQGGFQSDLTVTRLAEDDFLVITGTAQAAQDTAYIAHSIGADEHATVTEVTSGLGTLLITGPQSRDAIAAISPSDLSNAAFPFAAVREIEVGYARVLAVRLSFAGELGWELHVPTEMMTGIWDTLTAAVPGLVSAGANALNCARLEKGFRSWGHDMGPRETPLEAGLGFAVSWSKPQSFRGREALLRQRDAGIGKRLISMTLDGDAWPTGHHPVYRDGKLAGELASAAYSAMIGSSVALGWVERGSVKDDDLKSDRFKVEVGGKRYAAEIHLKAPFDPRGERMRG